MGYELHMFYWLHFTDRLIWGEDLCFPVLPHPASWKDPHAYVRKIFRDLTGIRPENVMTYDCD